ncbi:hypothetical protein V500_09074, partial [Pseudogymnoascus sp. VKM F-4518 (FW-2643)]
MSAIKEHIIHDYAEAPQPIHENVIVDGVHRYPPTGLKVLVVGGGPGGYLTAIECWRKGHQVELVEKNSNNTPIGDAFLVNPSGLCSLRYYPALLEAYQKCSWDLAVGISQFDGKPIVPSFDFEWNRPGVSAGLASMLYDQCERLGIKVKFGVNVLSYVENATEGTATAIADDGRQFTADIVVAADGLGTKPHQVVLGRPVRAVSTGYAIARFMYSLDGIQDAPLLDQLRDIKRPVLRISSGEDFHFSICLMNDHVLLTFTSPDDGTAEESWAQGVTPDEILSKVPDLETLDPLIIEIIRKIPQDKTLIRWKLCWRDPQEKWTSHAGRIVQLGDSAHAFIPTSLMGASTALEDAQSLPECLRLAGKTKANLGTKVHEFIRLRRVTIIQRTGFANRNESHQEGGMEAALKSAVDNDPLRMGKWVWMHNSERYATDKFAQALAHLETGASFEHTNIPPGFRWEEGWTMDKELEKEKLGIKTENLKRNGDWSDRGIPTYPVFREYNEGLGLLSGRILVVRVSLRLLAKMEPITPQEQLNRPLRLLSLDGGGIRGISELVILEEIMHRVDQALKQETAVLQVQKEEISLLPADYFDMICGTSTGGLIAILVGRLRLSVPEAIDTYRVLAKQVFSEKRYRVQDGKGHANDRMIMTDTVLWNCKTFVCAVPAMHINNQPRMFRTWLAKKNPEYNCTIWEAARATSAAPTIFKRIAIGEEGMEEVFIDGGLGCNNPVRYLVEEAAKEFGSDRKVNCIISIGTGKPKVAGFKAPGIFQRAIPLELIDVLKKMATDSEVEASRMEGRYQNCPGLYHRLNVEQGLQMVSLEEWEKLAEVRTHTKAYLNNSTISQGIDVIVDALVGKSSDGFPLGQLDGAVVAPINTHFCFLYPSHQVTHYVTRKDFVEAIQNHFRSRPDKSAPTITILHGMGGCGKTQVALEYCRRGQNEKWFSAIFWFDASSPTSMAQSFADAANELSKPNFDIADAKGNRNFVLSAIETKEIDWLLVFDNFDDPSAFGDESIKQYFPRSGHVSILFTTRHAGVKDMGLSIDVTSMLDKEALDLLLNRSHVERSDANMQEGANIVKRLGYHALAIDQAGAYIKAGDLDLCLYMEHYTERKEKVLSEIPELWEYQRRLKTDSEAMTKLTVFTTWELSVQLITGTRTAQKDKIHILTLAAFLDSKEVADDLFACYGFKNIDWLGSCVTDGVWDRYEAQDILKELRKLSLLQNLHIGKNGTTFSLHPLIQDWVKLRVKSDARRAFAVEAILLLSAFLDNHDTHEMTLSTKQALLSHLEGVGLQDAAFNFGYFFDNIGRYNLSEQMTRCAVKWRKKVLGKKHPDTLRTMSNLGIILEKQGKYNEAESIHRQVLELHEKVLGKEHLDTLLSMNNLGTVLAKQDKNDEAEQIFQQTLQLRNKGLNKEHPDILESMNNLVTILKKQ